MASLKNESDALAKNNQDLIAGVQEKDKTISGLIQNREQLLGQIKDIVDKIDQIQQHKSALEIQIHDLQAKDQQNTAFVDSLKSSLAQSEAAVKELTGKTAKFQDIASKMESQKNQYELKNKVLFKDNKLLKQKMDLYVRRVSTTALLKERLLRENSVLHYNLGVFYLQRQEHSEAIKEFEKVLELNPDDAATHYNLGIIYADYLDNKVKAIAHFKKYLMIDPKDKDADRAKKYILTWETWQDEKIEPHPKQQKY